ncbi:7286_t:CDS:2, partial [Dentiscutata erythropus]
QDIYWLEIPRKTIDINEIDNVNLAQIYNKKPQIEAPIKPQDAVNEAKGVSLMEKLIQRAKQSQK